MTIRKIETPLYSNREFDGLLDAASLMAGQFGAEVDVCFIQPLASNAETVDALGERSA